MLFRSSTLCVLAICVGACSQDAAGPHGGAPPSPMYVSNSQSAALAASIATASATRSTAQPNIKASRSVSIATDEVNVAYISLEPQTAPSGASAVITDVRTGASVTTPMVDGGIDPVPLPAAPGDSVTITIKTTGGITVETIANSVPKRRPPKIVRTIPGRDKTGVPLNKNIEIVFTEPVAQSSLSGSVQLLHAGAQVAGTAEILQGVTAAVVFTPTQQLEPNTDYELFVTNGVRDQDGDALDSAETVPFKTGTTTEGPVATLSITPEAADVRVGDQFQLVVAAKDANGELLTGRPISWWYTDSTVATVTNTGLVTARGEGSAFVLAEIGGFFVATSIRVSNALRPVASVTVSFDSASIAPGGVLRVAAIARDAEGNLLLRRLATWSSSNPNVAKVAGVPQSQPLEANVSRVLLNGIFTIPSAVYQANVSGFDNGVSRIVATIEGHSDTIVVTVANSSPIVGLTLSQDTATLLLRQTTRLVASSVNSAGGRADIPTTDVQWESSNPAVASVDVGGLVTAGEAGTATVIGNWTKYSATTRVTVIELAFHSVSAGRTHTCALTAGGSAYCWGANDFGQAGRPGIVDYGSLASARIFYPTPIPVTEGLTFSAITAGGFHSCGLTAAGTAYCWGFNGYGVLGIGSYNDSWRPVAVTGGHSFVSLDAGTQHTCGITAAGNAYCWGSNSSGQLGSSAVKSSTSPLLVAGGIAFASLSAGGSHTCALTSDGVAYCWGENAGGQLGVGESVTSSATPLPVSGGLNFAFISSGESHTCGITRSGSLYCWGWNLDDQLGNGIQFTPTSTPTAAASSFSFTSIGAASAHTCAIDVSSVMYCWGRNSDGQIGLGTITSELFATPQRVAGGVAFDRLSVGRSHTCAATAAGVWYCWGDNQSGALGVGSITDSGTPLKVLGQP
jgi:alpha-tubulin suppressor-like RCC1 family protein